MRIYPLLFAAACSTAPAGFVADSSSPPGSTVGSTPTDTEPTGESPTSTGGGTTTTSTGVGTTSPTLTTTTVPTTTTSPTVPDDCPPGVICLSSFPHVDANDTRDGASLMDGYGCAPDTDESGPEIVYRLDLAEEGLLALELDNLPAGVDVDVHLLASDDAGDCIDRGHWIAGSLLPAGQYWVVVDSWVSADGSVNAGSYDLFIGHTSVDELVDHGFNAEMAADALLAFDQALWFGDIDRFEYVLIDFFKLSTEPRLWVYDLATQTVLWHELTTHGEASSDPTDPRISNAFSNITDSHQSSIGVMVTAETYWGGNGYSMRYDGLEPGFNSNVRSRYIVMHPGSYATQDFVDAAGYLGESWGCTVVDPDINEAIIDDVKNGALVMAWYPDPTWRSSSLYLQ
jgi:hypothetical protein